MAQEMYLLSGAEDSAAIAGLMGYAHLFAVYTAIHKLFPRRFGISLTYVKFYHGYGAQGLDKLNLPYVNDI
jgi:hypothetical protein